MHVSAALIWPSKPNRNTCGSKNQHIPKEKPTMKFFSANIEDLRTLYVDSLQKALDMERKILKALPTMVEKSTDPDLASAFQTHLEQTKGHVTKVESILRRATGESSTTTCKAISSLITEAEDNIKDAEDDSVRDVTLIASGQQVEHHEIAVYGTLRTWAGILGEQNDVAMLESILKEEKAADDLLTQISNRVNIQAAA
jgi:ferritin-like metal-binding protein YciE